MSAMPDRKGQLIEAFTLENKAREIYDTMYRHFTAREKQNISKTLVAIIYHGLDGEYSRVNELYRNDKTKLTSLELRDINCFNRAAMAFSRRKKKETESYEELDNAIAQGNTGDTGNSVVSSGNEVVSTDKPSAKGTRTPSDKKKSSTPQNPEKLILAAMELVVRDDVKALLQQALIQLKLAVPIARTQYQNVTENLNTTFEMPVDIDDANYIVTTGVDADDNGVWW